MCYGPCWLLDNLYFSDLFLGKKEDLIFLSGWASTSGGGVWICGAGPGLWELG